MYPLLRIDETLDRMGNLEFYSSIDLAAGYWQIEIVEEDKEKTAFITRDGLFEFNGADIEKVMRAIGRWYDVTINYEAEKDSHRFTGQISRSVSASDAIQILATSGYHFNIQGKEITVLP